MSLKDVYQRFLADARSAPLASDVSLIYITSTTQIDGPDAVINQLTRQHHIVKVNSETVLDAIQSDNALCLDVETTIQFISGGGVYLPALDETFLIDRVVTFPTVHIVRFNSQNQIQNVRVYWDQGSLLKQVDVIGNRARNWPIRDADKQTRLIKSSAASAPASNGSAPAPTPAPHSAPAKEEDEQSREALGASPGKKHIKDPYAAESLFELLSPGKDRAEPVRPPRAHASAAPPPRDLSELFVGDDDDNTPEATPSRARAIAPKAGAGKNYRPPRIFGTEETEEAPTPVAPKAGAGKNFRPSRVFDTEEAGPEDGLEQIAYRAHPKRFDHFELGGDNTEREIKEPTSRPVSRHVAQWDFEDFSTPEKPRRKPRGEEVRHFGWSDDEPQDSPPSKPRVFHPRRDAETHFSLTDADDEQNGARIIRSYGNKGMNLYKETLYGDEDAAELENGRNAVQAPPLSVVQNGPNRKKDFESHWTVAGEISPAKNAVNLENKKPVASDRQKAVKMMESSWDATDEPSEPTKTAPPQRRALRNVNQRSWGLGDEDGL